MSEARCEKHGIRIQGFCPKCLQDDRERKRCDFENRIHWSEGHYELNTFGLQFVTPKGDGLNLEVKQDGGRAFREKWQELVARANKAVRMQSALADLIRCMEDGQCGDYSPMMDEYFDAKMLCDPDYYAAIADEANP